METIAMRIVTEGFLVHHSISNVHSFLTIPSNLNLLLPQERISEFTSDEVSCSFQILGGIKITLILGEVTPHSIQYQSGENGPMKFTLTIHMDSTPTTTTGNLQFKGDAPPVVAMVAKGPLTALFTEMASRLETAMDTQV